MIANVFVWEIFFFLMEQKSYKVIQKSMRVASVKEWK